MDVELAPDQRAFVQKAIESGRFSRAEDAIEEALSLWEERGRRRLELLAMAASRLIDQRIRDLGGWRARIPDPSRLFNSSLENNTRRAIDIHEGEKVDAGAFEALVRAAVARNGPPAKKRSPLRFAILTS